MTDKPMTVGDVRSAIKDLTDDVKVLVHYNHPYSNDISEMLPLGSLYLEEGKNGKALEIYPQFPEWS